jgi:hypothetical protein
VLLEDENDLRGTKKADRGIEKVSEYDISDAGMNPLFVVDS